MFGQNKSHIDIILTLKAANPQNVQIHPNWQDKIRRIVSVSLTILLKLKHIYLLCLCLCLFSKFHKDTSEAASQRRLNQLLKLIKGY